MTESGAQLRAFVIDRSRRAASLAPGLLLVAVFTALAYLGARLPGLKLLGPLVLALLVGVAWRASLRGAPPGVVQPGMKFAAAVLLRLGIVLLGVRLDLRALAAVGPTVLVGSVLGVVVAWLSVELLGRARRVPVDLRRSVAIGTGVCGASAIAAALPVLRAKEENASLAVAAVSVLGTLGVVAFAAGDALALMPSRLLGALAGATLQEVGQVVAAGAAIGSAAGAADGVGEIALLVKLSRVVLLAPVLMLLGWWTRRSERLAGSRASLPVGAGASSATATEVLADLPSKLPPLVPGFVVGFLAMSAATSLGWFGPAQVAGLTVAATVLTAAAMAGIGMGVALQGMGRAGRQALWLGLSGFAAMVLTMGVYYAWALR